MAILALCLGGLLLLAHVAARGDSPAQLTVAIDGIDNDAIKKNVLLFLSIAGAARDGELSEGRVRALHARADGEIRQALAAFGYYRPVIAGEIEQVGDVWRAGYRIDPGPPMRMAKVNIEIIGAAADDPEFRRLPGALALRVGDPLLHSRYEDSKRELQELAYERGYFDARLVTQELRIDVGSNTAEAVLHLDSGPAYRFGEARFDPPDILRPALLARYIRFRPGDPYRHSQVLELQRALVDSQNFDQVEVLPDPHAARDLQVPIDIRLVVRDPDRYKVGVGYGTDTGVRGSFGWERRPLNDRGHRAGAGIGVSQIRTAVTTRYAIPVGDPRTDLLTYNLSWTEDRPETSNSRTSVLSAAYAHDRFRGRETLSLAMQQESFRTGTDSGRTTLLMPGVDWLWVQAEDRLAPPRGWRLAVLVRGASESLGSDLSFVQTHVQGKFIWPVTGAGRLLARLEAGATSVARFEDLPATLRYYAGGDQSIRGYAYHALGPADDTGDVIGGEYLTVAGVEYEHRLVERWRAAVFYDVGRAFSSSDQPYAAGTGAGLRWQSPIGPVRLDIAWAITEPDRPWRLHLTIGPDL